MMDFFGTGWDVAARMGLEAALRAIRYPIDSMEYVDASGRAYVTVPIRRIRRAFADNYVYLRRPDLVRMLYERGRAAGVDIRFGTTIRALANGIHDVWVGFDDGREGSYSLVFGADGVHSRVRELVFGPEDAFARFLGLYVAAFHIADHDYGIGRAVKLYEETDRLAALYPLDANRLDATYVFRHADIGHVPSERRLALTRDQFRGAGWIAERVLADVKSTEPIFFDSITQIVMPQWQRGRVALLGDACGCLTLLAGQGSHMAMAGAYVLAQELARHRNNHADAFAAYEAFLKPHVAAKQKSAAQFARVFLPAANSRPWLRRAAIRMMFSGFGMRYVMGLFGARSVLAPRAPGPAAAA